MKIQRRRETTTDSPIAAAVHKVLATTDLKPSTRRTYLFASRHFVEWAAARPIHQMILVEYKTHLRETRLSAKTCNLYLASVRTVFRQLHLTGALPFDASKAVKSFSISRTHKRPPITDRQIERAFDFAETSGDFRLQLFLTLMFRQGLRQKEVVDLRVEHFNEHAGTLAILGKGRDDRELIHLHPQTVRVFRHYLDELGINSGFVFPGRKDRSRHLTTAALYRLIREMHRSCRIANSPHGWRKVFTSKLIEAGMNLLDVQAYTRHAGLSQLQVYFDRLQIQKTLPTYYAAFSRKER